MSNSEALTVLAQMTVPVRLRRHEGETLVIARTGNGYAVMNVFPYRGEQVWEKASPVLTQSAAMLEYASRVANYAAKL